MAALTRRLTEYPSPRLASRAVCDGRTDALGCRAAGNEDRRHAFDPPAAASWRTLFDDLARAANRIVALKAALGFCAAQRNRRVPEQLLYLASKARACDAPRRHGPGDSELHEACRIVGLIKPHRQHQLRATGGQGLSGGADPRMVNQRGYPR